MKFDRLNIRLLEKLQKSGYTVLTSTSKIYEEVVYWFPEKVPDVDNYLYSLDKSNGSQSQTTILVIDDALNNMENRYYFGYVFCF